MKSIFSKIGIAIVAIIVIVFSSFLDFVERHYISLIAVLAGIAFFILYLKPEDNDNQDIPPKEFQG